jgi:hypothetical protein
MIIKTVIYEKDNEYNYRKKIIFFIEIIFSDSFFFSQQNNFLLTYI